MRSYARYAGNFLEHTKEMRSGHHYDPSGKARPGRDMHAEMSMLRKAADTAKRAAVTLAASSALLFFSYGAQRSQLQQTKIDMRETWFGNRPVVTFGNMKGPIYDYQTSEATTGGMELKCTIDAVRQTDPKVKYAMYILNGLTDKGSWVQLGVIDLKGNGDVARGNGDKDGKTNAEFGVFLQVYNGGTGSPMALYQFPKPIKEHDRIQLKLRFESKNGITASARDIDSGESITIKVPGELGKGITFADGWNSRGNFTGYMTEAYETAGKHVPLRKVTYLSTKNSPISIFSDSYVQKEHKNYGKLGYMVLAGDYSKLSYADVRELNDSIIGSFAKCNFATGTAYSSIDYMIGDTKFTYSFGGPLLSGERRYKFVTGQVPDPRN